MCISSSIPKVMTNVLREIKMKMKMKMKMRKFQLFLLLCLFLMLNLFAIFRDSTLNAIVSRLVINHQPCTNRVLRNISNKGDDVVINDKFLGGLLAHEFDGSSCLSRYQSNLYRRTQAHKPSSHLISKLRNYESLHKKCGPNTVLYKNALENLKYGGKNITYSLDCKYVIWIPYEGLGNRIMTLTSTFLYALLSNRVLLLADDGTQIQDLFCEPFPDVSWLLPKDFPIIDMFTNFNKKSPHRYGNLMKENSDNGNLRLPPFVHIQLHNIDTDEDDMVFFCDQDQTLLQNVPWLISKSNQYFLPALFWITSFQQELNNLFPEKDTVFHHLGRYLFHPTNSVWVLITRYYEAYLAKADENLGIQIRVFNEKGNGTFKHVLNQVLDCTMKEKLLPEIHKNNNHIIKSENRTLKAAMITSLRPYFYEEIRNMYLNYATNTGEVVAFHQPSREEIQQTGNHTHERKALAEMYLLSMTDKLVTSARSTFGYVAHSLGGLQPWFLYKPHDGQIPDPPCRHAVSMEPCFHESPPFLSCRKEKKVATDNIVPFVKHCEDVSEGLKLFDSDKLNH